MTQKKILFIINPIAGVWSKEKLPLLIQEVLDKKLFKVAISFTKYAGHAIELTQNAIKKKMDIVVAVGGDGSVNEVASQLVGTNVLLAIIPGGSGNGFARKLGIPIVKKKALAVINELRSIRVDVGRINNQYFFSNAGVGFEATVVNTFAKTKMRGLTEYFRTGTMQYFNYDAQQCLIEVGGETIDTKAFQINFSNTGQYGYNIGVTPESDLTDGLLEMSILKDFGRWRVSYMLPVLLVGKAKALGSLEVRTIDRAKLITERPTSIQIDGDPGGQADTIEVDIMRQKLGVIIPEERYTFKAEMVDRTRKLLERKKVEEVETSKKGKRSKK